MASINVIGTGSPIQTSLGGQGNATLTQNAILQGNGSGNIIPVGPGTNGQILIGSSTGNPVWANLTAGTNVTIANGANSINITASGSISGGSITAFTPVLNFTTSSAGISYTSQFGQLCQVGKCVYFNFYIALSSKGTASGNAYITGLTGTMTGQTLMPQSIVMSNVSGNPSYSYFATTGQIDITTNYLYLINNNPSGNNNAAITSATFTNTSTIYGSGFYFTT